MKEKQSAKKKSKKKKASEIKAKPERPEVKGVLFLASALLLLLSLLSFAYVPPASNWLGLIGSSIGWVFLAFLGLGSYVLCCYLGWLGWRFLFRKSVNHPELKTLSIIVMILSMNMLLSVLEDQSPRWQQFLGSTFYTHLWSTKLRYHLGGAPFYFLYRDLPTFNLLRLFNVLGVTLIFTTSFLASFLFLTKFTLASIGRAIASLFSTLFNIRQAEPDDPTKPKEERSFLRFVKLRIPGQATANQSQGGSTTHPSQEMLAIKPETNLKERPSLSRKGQDDIPSLEDSKKIKKLLPQVMQNAPSPSVPKTKREVALAAQSVYNGDFKSYEVPGTSLLTNGKKVDQTALKKDLRRQAEVLEETLQSFGIEAKVGEINCGPAITSFEVHPSIGVKVQKIKALENDIALNMEAKSIRIIAPIPGKAAVGIEVPNAQPQEVSFKDMLAAYQQSGKKFHIPILLGKAVNGDYVMSDLTKMPHCIIAGATGSGKSVCINTIVMSILLNARPDEIKLIMVDPKKVELTPYSRLPHMLAPVITEPRGACAALQWLVKEMEKRYEILKQLGVRNIDSFNNRTVNKALEESLDLDIPDKMHYIVGIIDELADLMMVSSNDIETPIARIAQMARAVGIHLILATQRPSREVITGLIKANFPTRIAFKVASRVNSQIILDEVGAETLLGNGDMLFLPPGTSHLMRAQGAFIRDEDINSVVEHICKQSPPRYVIQSFDTYEGPDDKGDDDKAPANKDSLYQQAHDLVMQVGNASTTFLQRKLKIGYARAASLIDQLQEEGVISPSEGSKPRKVLKHAGGDDSDAGASLGDIDD